MKKLASIIAAVLMLTGFLAVTASAALADSGDRTLGYVVTQEGEFGSDCSSGPFHNNVTAASNGDTIQIWGCGSFSTKNKTADGGGRFIHTTSTNTIEGDWTALKLLRYHSYGGSVEFAGLTFEGGVGTFAVRLTPDGGSPVDAVLHVYCNLGDPPPGSVEGIRLTVEGGPNFNEQLSGETGFFTS